jgi:PBP1b-binding outer membrane lipoprotein LpoB
MSNIEVLKMKRLFIFLLALFIVACSSDKRTVAEEKTIPKDTVKVVQTPVITKRAAVKQNLTLVAAIVDSVEILDSLNYMFVVKLQTAIPERNFESFTEPGQIITVYPGYQLDESKQVDMKNPVNKKLFEMRSLKRRGHFIGKVTLASDMKWYITQVEVYQNAPKGNYNEK